MTEDTTKTPELDDDEQDLPPDPDAVAANVQAAAARLREMAAEARDLYAVIGEGYTFSKTLKPMARRYTWREAAGLNVIKGEEQRFAARWANERTQIEREMGVPPMAWTPRAILTAFGAWQAKRGKRKRKSEAHEHWDRLPALYMLDEVEYEHPDLANAALRAARQSATSANGGALDRRLVIAALQGALEQEVRAFATDINMDGGNVNVARAVETEQGTQKRAYDHDDDF